jgi:single-strand DNA-binding protein
MNKVVFMGRLTKEPELRYTTSQTPVANFTLAVPRRFAKEDKQKADFFQVVAWDKLGEFCGKYFHKGLKVLVVGRLETRTWEDAEGHKHYVTELIAEEAHFAEKKQPEKANEADSAPFEYFGTEFPEDASSKRKSKKNKSDVA